jgi:hypothetical protein
MGDDAGPKEGGPAVPGEYWIKVNDGASGPMVPEQMHVRVTSASEAVVWRKSVGTETFSIEHSSGVEVGVEPLTPTNPSDPRYVVHGPFVMKNMRNTATGYGGLHSIAVGEADPGHFGSSAMLLYATSQGCHAISEWKTAPATASPDVESTSASIEGDGTPLAPWAPFRLVTSKPAAPGWSRAVSAMADGAPVEVSWDSEFTGAVDGVFPSWPSLLGKNVEFSGAIPSTNGINAPFAASLTLMRFGLTRTGSIDLRASQPADLDVWGSDRVAPGNTCSMGCLHLMGHGGLALRFAAGTTGIFVRYRTGVIGPAFPPLPPVVPLVATTMVVGSQPVVTSFADARDAFADFAVPVPNAPGEVLLWLAEQEGRFDPVEAGCVLAQPWDVYLESITVTPPP